MNGKTALVLLSGVLSGALCACVQPPEAAAPAAPPPPPRPPLWHTSGTPVPSGPVAVILRPMLPLQAAIAAGASVATNPIKTIGAM